MKLSNTIRASDTSLWASRLETDCMLEHAAMPQVTKMHTIIQAMY
jgi:hypothetical protein